MQERIVINDEAQEARCGINFPYIPSSLYFRTSWYRSSLNCLMNLRRTHSLAYSLALARRIARTAVVIVRFRRAASLGAYITPIA